MTQRRAIAYRRVSTTKLENRSGLETQQLEILAFSKREGIAVVKDVVEVSSAEELDEREVLTDLRLAFRTGVYEGASFDCLLVWRYDRFSRDQVHQAVVVYEARKYGIEILSATENFDNSPLGDFMRSTVAFAAKLEAQGTRIRTRAGYRRRIEKGNLPGATYPRYGYRFADEHRTRYEVNPDTVDNLRFIFTRLDEGASIGQMCRELKARGIPSPTGKPHWNNTTIRHIINDPIYYGEPLAYKGKVAKRKVVDDVTGAVQVFERRVPGERVLLPADVAPPLVSKELWTRVHEKLALNKYFQAREQPGERFTLKGHIYCARCGRRMNSSANSNRPTWLIYDCNTHSMRGDCSYNGIYAPKAERIVWAHLIGLLNTPDLLVSRLREQRRQSPNDPDTLRAQLREIKETIKALETSIETSRNSEHIATLTHRVDDLHDEADVITIRLAETAEVIARDERFEERLARLVSLCEGMARGQPLCYADKREVLRLLGVKVWVSKHGVNPDGRIEVQTNIICTALNPSNRPQ